MVELGGAGAGPGAGATTTGGGGPGTGGFGSTGGPGGGPGAGGAGHGPTTGERGASSLISHPISPAPPAMGHWVQHDIAAPTRRAGHVASRGGKSGLSNEPIFPQPLCLSEQHNMAKNQKLTQVEHACSSLKSSHFLTLPGFDSHATRQLRCCGFWSPESR